MKRAMLAIAVSVTLLIGAGSAYAGNDKDKTKPKSDETNVRAVPEIDATSGLPAIALVLGVALLGAERLRRRSERAS